MEKTLANFFAETYPEKRKDHFSEDIQHLLSRALFGISPQDQKLFYSKSRKQVVEKLLKHEFIISNKPLKDYDSIHSGNPDQNISWGNSWVHDYNHDLIINEKRKNSLKNWMVGVLYGENPLTIAPNLFLFWVNFFGVEASRIPFAPRLYNHLDIIRTNSLGNFHDLLTNVLTDPALVYYCKRIMPRNSKILEFTTDQLFNRYLGGTDFSKSISNEKRKKLIRLLNKWNLICDSAPIHYTSIRGKDIYHENNQPYLEAYFDRPDAREVLFELRSVLLLIMKSKSVATHLTRKVFRHFLNPVIDSDDEKNLIEPVAHVFLSSQYDIKNWMQEFFLRDHFYHEKFRHSKLKQPLPFLLMTLKQLDIKPENTVEIDKYAFWEWIRYKSLELGQNICDSIDNESKNESEIQNVSQLNEKSLHDRYLIIQNILESGISFKGEYLNISPINLAKQFHNPSNPVELLKEVMKHFYTARDGSKNLSSLANILLDSGEGINADWFNLWISATESGDPSSIAEINFRLSKLFSYMMIQPEYNYY